MLDKTCLFYINRMYRVFVLQLVACVLLGVQLKNQVAADCAKLLIFAQRIACIDIDVHQERCPGRVFPHSSPKKCVKENATCIKYCVQFKPTMRFQRHKIVVLFGVSRRKSYQTHDVVIWVNVFDAVF